VTNQSQDGVVISQSPGANTQVDPGTTVALTVGKYVAPQVTVPNLVGDTQAAAQSKLDGAGLKLSVAPGSTTSAGTVVVQQSPAAGSKVDAGSTVVVTIDFQIN
jgi:eukaryotic-like serine/threonine-protein kinase